MQAKVTAQTQTKLAQEVKRADDRVAGLCGCVCVAVWLCGCVCVAVWLCGCVAVWVWEGSSKAHTVHTGHMGHLVRFVFSLVLSWSPPPL